MPRAGNLTEENLCVQREFEHGAFRSHHIVTCSRGVTIIWGPDWMTGFIDTTLGYTLLQLHR
jgi:hypothetical protein